MKHILIINTVPFIQGGMSSVILSYYLHMDLTEYAVDFVVNKEIVPEYERVMRENHARIYVFERNRCPLWYMSSLYRLLKEQQYDVVHIHGNSATMILETIPAWGVGVGKRIVHCHNTRCNHPVLNKWLKFFFRKTYTNALACSETAGKWLFGAKNFEVLPNGIDICKYAFLENIRLKIRKNLGIEDRFVVGHVGFMNEQKNHKKLFSVFRELKKQKENAFLLCIAGNQEIPRMIENEIKKNGLDEDVRILLRRDDVHELLQAVDVFVFPSKWEGFAMALIEAQASGLPCVVSDRCDHQINLTGRMIFLSLDESDSVWASAVQNLEKISDRNAISKAMKGCAYDIMECKTRLEDIYEN